jgi:hypothetical protein
VNQAPPVSRNATPFCCIGALRSSPIVRTLPSTRRPTVQIEDLERCARAPIDSRALLHRRVRSVERRCQRIHTLYFHGLLSPSRLCETSRCVSGSRGSRRRHPAPTWLCTEAHCCRGVCPDGSLTTSCRVHPRVCAALRSRPPWGL